MVTVAALSFGDIPTKAFIEAFNIKEMFLDNSDESGFSKMIRVAGNILIAEIIEIVIDSFAN